MFYSVRGVFAGMFAAAALAGGAGIALADVKAGVDAWSAGDFEGAVREWKRPADAGDPDAQFNLAQAYKLGRGVPHDLARAESLYAAAAAKGHLEASDAYGILLFQRGEREKAAPYIKAAAARGDARAQYIHGLALFNGDGVDKDWVRAYAYASLAQQGGLPQATVALAQMDQHIPMADRQKAVSLAGEIATRTEATRARQLAAFNLGSTPSHEIAPTPAAQAGQPPTDADRAPSRAVVEQAVADAARVAGTGSRTAAPRLQAVDPGEKPSSPTSRASSARSAAASSLKAQPPRAAERAKVASGPWRVQLGAFGVASNADGLWKRVKDRPELAGHGKLVNTADNLTRLQASGFASREEANAACARLKSAGFACLATRD
ncbi:SPOR domain-containing protein [Novosphingobium sp. RD2P27]|uniref:SPOR domain-containing protein n=1 Tax=Novosphingobium kalidii TaxID=3230299 RepID=A0ABV2D130_9SPHN